MKTINRVLAVAMVMLLAAGCRKKEDNTQEDAELKAKKTAYYNDKGYNYLFSLKKGQADSLSPIYFAKTSKGEVKFIFGEYRAGVLVNAAGIFNGVINAWGLPGLDLRKVNRRDNYSLVDDFLEYESVYNSSFGVYYSEKDAPGTSDKRKTGIGDSLSVRMSIQSRDRVWSSYFVLNDLYYKHGAYTLTDSLVFKGAIFEYNDLSYMMYYKPLNPQISSLDSIGAVMHFSVRSKAGSVFQNNFCTDKLAGVFEDKEAYIEGLEARLIETGTPDPMFMFWTYKGSAINNKVVLWPSFRNKDLIDITFPYSAEDMKFFSYRGLFYGNTSGALFKTNNTAAASLSVALNLDKIKGIYGSSNAILLVLENDQKGLDVVEMR